MNDDVIVSVKGGTACLLLNRPANMNALTYEMVLAIDQALIGWSADDSIKQVAIAGTGDRAFCAGGDVLSFYRAIEQRTADSYAEQFFTAEYNMNRRMREYPKPLISLMHGIVMGGGVGASAHANHRIAFSDLRLALPECSIGLIPDVGSSYILARAPGNVGKYIGLTGSHLDAADAVYCGFADKIVSADKRVDLWQALVEGGGVEVIEEAVEKSPPMSVLQAHSSEIDAIFGSDDIAVIMQNLEAGGESYAKPLAVMRSNSPLSMGLFLRVYEHARGCDDLWQALGFEYRITSRLAQSREFYEGIRAQLVDKDRNPRWRYGLGEVTDEVIKPFVEEVILRERN